jgi:hypothetical protein
MARRSSRPAAAPDAEWIKPSTAATRFDVSERTLARWAARGLIGKTGFGRRIWYRAADVAELLSVSARPRTVVPIAARGAAPAEDDWRSDDFWKGAAPR